jgi:glycosyltransferase involved in cell wall biosynthesis
VRSLLASTYTDWDAVIVDQSHTDTTECTVQALIRGDPRFRYIMSPTTGSSVARNLALACATGPLVAFTDDDCEVFPEWMDRLVQYFRRYPDSGLIYGAVHPGPFDPRAGFIPTCRITRLRRITTPSMKWRERGIGANMASPLEVLRAVGGFDEVLGSGGPLRANLDGDLTYRVLKAGYPVLDVPDAVVIHHGFRTWQQGRKLMRGVGIGLGATYMKHVRLGDPAAVPTFLIEWVLCISWGRLLTLQRHTGLGCFLNYAAGAILSFRYSIDPRTRAYRIPQARQVDEARHTDRNMLIPLAVAMPRGQRFGAPPPSLVAGRGPVPLHVTGFALPCLGSISIWLLPLLLLAVCVSMWRIEASQGLRWLYRGLA